MAIITLAAAAGISTLALEDRYPWITVASPRRLSGLRTAWGALVVGAGMLLAVVSVPFLPASLPAVDGYLATASLWLGLSMIGVVVGGRYIGMFGPLAVCGLMVAGLLPWEWNILINQELTGVRLMLATALPIVGLAAYAFIGAASSRRRRAS